ncbi:hypothetical protein M569_15645, partial [Genlisea aurea]
MGGSASFKVALFADLHFGEDSWTEWGPMQDLNSLRVMSNVLDLEQPDFVVYLGDVITANNMMVRNASLYWSQAVSPARDRGIPWCSVFGNHDDAPFEWPLDWFSETGIPPLSPSGEQQPLTFSSSRYGDCCFQGTTRLELMRDEIRENVLSYSRIGRKELRPGVSNYFLTISSSHDSPSSPAAAYLYFLDSGGGSYPEVISAAQVKWFQQTSMHLNPNMRHDIYTLYIYPFYDNLTSGFVVPELIFWHIPSESYQNVAPKADGHMNCVGSIFGENVAPQRAELGMMHLLQQRSSAKAVFVGHNHGLDWCCPHANLWLCFARHTGYGGYGNWARGSRIIEIKRRHPFFFSVETWIRMEDGGRHSQVILSA